MSHTKPPEHRVPQERRESEAVPLASADGGSASLCFRPSGASGDSIPHCIVCGASLDGTIWHSGDGPLHNRCSASYRPGAPRFPVTSTRAGRLPELKGPTMKRFTMTATIDLPDGVFAEAKTLTALEAWIEGSVRTGMPEGVSLTQEVSTIRKAKTPPAAATPAAASGDELPLAAE